MVVDNLYVTVLYGRFNEKLSYDDWNNIHCNNSVDCLAEYISAE